MPNRHPGTTFHVIQMNLKTTILSACACFALSGCARTNFNAYYNSENLPVGSFCPIEKGRQPVFKETMNLQNMVRAHEDAGYVVIGTMPSRGEMFFRSEIMDFAKEKGASIVLYSQKRVGDIEKHYTIHIVHANTSYTSISGTGSVYNGPFNSSTVNVYGRASTTTYDTEYIHCHYIVGDYKQMYIFMAKKGN